MTLKHFCLVSIFFIFSSLFLHSGVSFARSEKHHISVKVHQVLLNVSQLQKEENWEKAEETLQSLFKNGKLSRFERVICQIRLGHIRIDQKKLDSAIQIFKKVVASRDISTEMRNGIRFNLAQLQFQAGHYNEGIQQYQKWLSKKKHVRPRYQIQLAKVMTRVKRYAEATQIVESVLKTKRNGPEKWHNLLLKLYTLQNQNKKSITVLEYLTHTYPQKTCYWLNLSGRYAAVKNYKKAAAVLETAYLSDRLKTSPQILYYAAILLRGGLPHKAGTIIETGIANLKLPANYKTLKTLYTAWQTAKDKKKAMETLHKLADVAPTGDYYIYLAQVYAEHHRWNEVKPTIQKGFNKGLEKEASRADRLLSLANHYQSGHAI